MYMGRRPHMDRPLNARTFHVGFEGPYGGRISRSDEEIKRDIESTLFYDSWVDSEAIRVDVKEGVVTLSGTAVSASEKRLAGDDAWDIAGVKDVQNNLSVEAGGSESQSSPRGDTGREPGT